ncbi:MAG: hypothetical protein H0Z32_05175 [Bacillaceae bacterium]|nr:hypothetical protein [Bacillaceae bacterium]
MRLLNSTILFIILLAGCSSFSPSFSGDGEGKVWADTDVSKITIKTADPEKTINLTNKIVIQNIVEGINQAPETLEDHVNGEYLGRIQIQNFGSIDLFYSKKDGKIYLVSFKGQKEILSSDELVHFFAENPDLTENQVSSDVDGINQ